MYTSEEIRQITFEKTMRGYRPEDVESFLEKIAEEYEAMQQEKSDLEEKLYLLAEKVEQYKSGEESIKVTLINAQRLGESIVADARAKADDIVREATIKKNDILASAYSEIEGSEDVLKKLKREVSEFKRTVLGLYKAHIESLSNLPEEKVEIASAETPARAEEIAVEAETVRTDMSSYETSGDAVDTDGETAEKFKNVSSLFDEE